MFGKAKPVTGKHVSTERDTQPLILERQESSSTRPHSHNPAKAAREPRDWSER